MTRGTSEWLSPEAIAEAVRIGKTAPPLTDRQRVLIRETFRPFVEKRIAEYRAEREKAAGQNRGAA